MWVQTPRPDRIVVNQRVIDPCTKVDAMSEHDEDHGHSVAAWSAVIILIIAAAIMSFAVLFPNGWVFAGGAVLVLVGVVAGKVLSMAGYGSAERDRDEEPSIR